MFIEADSAASADAADVVSRLMLDVAVPPDA
jgi:hypothetical protein